MATDSINHLEAIVLADIQGNREVATSTSKILSKNDGNCRLFTITVFREPVVHIDFKAFEVIL